MSEAITIARPYAKAAFNHAQQKNNAQAWLVMLQALGVAAADSNSVMLLQDPNVSDDKIAEMFVDVCQQHIDDDGKRFVKILAEATRLSVLPEIAEIYEQLFAESQQSIAAQIFSAFEIDSAQIEKMRVALQARLQCDVTIETHLDESLIGGALIRAGDLVIDGTLRSRVDRLKDELMSI